MDRAEKFWDGRAESFDAPSGNDDPDPIYTRKIEVTKKYLDTDAVVLDFACATGYISLDLADVAGQVHGIDISSKMIEAAKRRAAEREIENVHFAHATVFDDKYASESFDVVLAFNILHLVNDRPKVIQRINELLKPGGVFISATPSVESMSLPGLLMVLLSKIGIVPHLKFSTVSELEEMVLSEKFQIVESEFHKDTIGHHFIVAKKQ